MLESPTEQKYAAKVAVLMHADKPLEAAQYISDFCELGLKLDDDNPAKYLPVLQNYLHYLLNNDGTEEAAQMLWTPTLFSPGPQFTKDVWRLFDSTNRGLIMGAGSCSKSFTIGVRMFLEWIRDPDWTSVNVIGPSEDHLETNLFSHLVGLHQQAKLPMPGKIGELFIGVDRRNQLGSIKGVVIPVGKVKKAGRLQGKKRKPRAFPHPIFGPLSRLFIFVDEIENVPGGLWSDIDNILSNVDQEGVDGFKIFGAYNPTNRGDEVAKRAEPSFGWEAFDVDNHYRWTSVRGWEVLRLDGQKSENVVTGKTIYPGLQTRNGLEALARNAGGLNSAGYMTMGRGAYPSQGVELTIIPPGMVSKMRGEFIWLDDPEPIGSCDLALDGGASAVFTLGKFGKAAGVKFMPSLEFPKGRTVMFKDRNGQPTPRMGLQADQQFILPKGDTVAMKTKLIDTCQRAGIKGDLFSCDRTGSGTGIADLMRYEWSSAIHDINYSEGATDSKIMSEDRKTCAEEYDRIATELWFATRAFGEFGYLMIHPQIDMTKLSQQLTQRKHGKSGAKKKVESKRDYISRGFESPDEADSLTLLVAAFRMGSGVTLSMSGGETEPDEDRDPYWYEDGGGARIDPSNKTESLQEEAML